MVASGFFVFNVAPIHWCEQIKTKITGLRGKAGVSMLGLNQFFGKRVSVIPPGSRKEPSTKVPGFLFYSVQNSIFISGK
jgi:hypothetical protein